MLKLDLQLQTRLPDQELAGNPKRAGVLEGAMSYGAQTRPARGGRRLPGNDRVRRTLPICELE